MAASGSFGKTWANNPWFSLDRQRLLIDHEHAAIVQLLRTLLGYQSQNNSAMDTSKKRSGQVRHVTVSGDRSGQRLDNFLFAMLDKPPRSLVYRLVRTGQVRVNGSRAKPMQKLKEGDDVRLPPVQSGGSGPVKLPEGLEAQIRDRILHADNDLVVLDKPSGLAVHGGSGLHFGLVHVLEKIHPGARPAHRLDRGTSGILVSGRNRRALKALEEAFRGGRVEKRYLVLLAGRLPEDRMMVDAPLKKIRDGSGQGRVIVDPAGDTARSTFQVLSRPAGHTFAEVQIETGRTHQIRVHAQHLGYPVVGDELYNADPAAGQSRLFLHCHYLRLPWPEDRVFDAPLPDELKECLDRLESGQA